MMRLALVVLALPLAFGARLPAPKHCVKGTPKDSCALYLRMANNIKASPESLGVPLHPSLKAATTAKMGHFEMVTAVSSEPVKTLVSWYQKRLPKWHTMHLGDLWMIASKNDQMAAMSMAVPEVQVMACPGGTVVAFACKTQVNIVYPAKK